MTLDEETLERPSTVDAVSGGALPGAVIVFSDREPLLHVLPLQNGMRRLGRGDGPGGALPDPTLSREHVEVRCGDDGWTITDLDSRNGSFVDGERIRSRRAGSPPRCLRISNTLVLLCDDVRPLVGGQVQRRGEQVIGPRLAAVLERVRRAAAADSTLLISGESGSGKELMARAFHEGGSRARGPFVATNCAAIPAALAERLLFGARKGVYSGAEADSDGYVHAAAGGVLFLDEVGELDLAVQAKLLRLVETRELLPLGAVRARPVDVQFCCATHRGLRDQVAAGQFREDLLFRIAQSTVTVPPLRERREEIPWLVEAQLARQSGRPQADARLIEQCLLRAWPGNSRQLLAAVAEAARERLGSEPLRLAPDAGESAAPAATPLPAARPRTAPSRDEIEAALAAHAGQVAATARALGLQRTALYRLMKQLGVRGGKD